MVPDYDHVVNVTYQAEHHININEFVNSSLDCKNRQTTSVALNPENGPVISCWESMSSDYLFQFISQFQIA